MKIYLLERAPYETIAFDSYFKAIEHIKSLYKKFRSNLTDVSGIYFMSFSKQFKLFELEVNNSATNKKEIKIEE